MRGLLPVLVPLPQYTPPANARIRQNKPVEYLYTHNTAILKNAQPRTPQSQWVRDQSCPRTTASQNNAIIAYLIICCLNQRLYICGPLFEYLHIKHLPSNLSSQTNQIVYICIFVSYEEIIFVYLLWIKLPEKYAEATLL